MSRKSDRNPPFYIRVFIVSIIGSFLVIRGLAASPPNIMLAETFDQSRIESIQQYWVSEKLDGVRARWDGNNLISRQGNHFKVPQWFLADFPTEPLDGELWIARNNFQELISIIKGDDIDPNWHQVKFMVFDYPNKDLNFSQRLKHFSQLVRQSNSKYIEIIPQKRITDLEVLNKWLDQVIEEQGEGLMLHHENALYISGRSSHLLKVKRHDDGEATVIGYTQGKGKYKNAVGALVVKTDENIVFKLGTGLSDQERIKPPPIGSLVTYKFYGKTKSGKPRFASYLRIRELP